jgi:hypothetical protein
MNEQTNKTNIDIIPFRKHETNILPLFLPSQNNLELEQFGSFKGHPDNISYDL